MKHWTTLKKLIWLKFLRAAAAVLKTVTGNAPLTLTNAIARAIHSLTQTGLCAQASTPTPTSPVDIVCNNGALRMLNLANMTEDNIVCGKYINNSGTESSAASNFYYSPFIPVKASTAYTLKTSRSLNYSNIMEYDASKGFLERTLYGSTGTPAGDTTTHTTRADTAFIRFGANINGSTLTAEDVLAIDWMLSEGATATDYVPYGQLSTVGTPEVITVCGKNLLNPATDTVGAYLNADGEPIAGGVYRYSSIIPVKEGSYVFSGTCNPSTGQTKRIHGYLNGVWVQQIEYKFIYSNSPFSISFTVPSGVNGIRVSYYTGDTDVMVEEGEAATEYEAYASHGTASAENLFAVGDYADTQEIIGGAVTRNCRVVVFDGTETGWNGDFNTASGTIARYYMNGFGVGATGRTRLLSTHFNFGTGNADGVCFLAASGHLFFERLTADGFTTKDAWTDWLKAQYAAGTPLICVVPIADPTTESVTAQSLSTADGTNTVSVAAEVNPVALSCEYYATE